ncbi:MAG: Nif3-like dinuclear metal center hexameric protein [Phycisphaerae bacterium]|nr:Nif3-like dinuclear metal center hexameric protein [Phycisphaerae bacterium]
MAAPSKVRQSYEQVVQALQRIAPPHLAETWDNTGLLICPLRPKRAAKNILLTIDLTEAVLAEATAKKTHIVVAYHPPIFQPLRAIGPGPAASRIVAGCAEAGLAVYSPHTALDAVPGGLADWLAEGLGTGRREPLRPSAPVLSPSPDAPHKLVVFVPPDHVDRLRRALSNAGAGQIGDYEQCSFNLPGTGTFLGGKTTRPAVGRKGRLETVPEIRLEMICPGNALGAAVAALREVHPYEEPAFDIYPLTTPGAQEADRPGAGRKVQLEKPVTLPTLLGRIKRHLKLRHLRVATAPAHRRGRRIGRVGLCPGAGGSLLAERLGDGDPGLDLYLTGEMRHHDVLAANAAGVSVVLTEHTNSERGYLPTLRQRLRRELGRDYQVTISRKDAEPLQVS